MNDDQKAQAIKQLDAKAKPFIPPEMGNRKARRALIAKVRKANGIRRP